MNIRKFKSDSITFSNRASIYYGNEMEFLHNPINPNCLTHTSSWGYNISEDFFNNAISVKKLCVKIKRDKVALSEYLNSDRRPGYSADELYMLDIMRQGEKPDDPRL